VKRQLQVGDRVRVYGHSAMLDGQIATVTNASSPFVKGYIFVVKDDGEPGEFELHPKQCRRLVKKKRREWWITRGACGDPMCTCKDCEIETLHTSEQIKTDGKYVKEIIHVREVKK
jgi:hypothetical protein